MKFILNLIITICILFVLDAVWLNTVSGPFYFEQLSEIGRFKNGEWDIRLIPGFIVYLMMAAAIEVFIFNNQSVDGLKSTLFHGALLGFLIYGVYDFTNRAILLDYPMAMVIVDVAWGSILFTAVTFLKYQLKNKITVF